MEEARTLSDLAHVRKTVGVNQSRKAVRNHRAKQVFLACDAAPGITAPLAADCQAAEIPVIQAYTMEQLGDACSIAVGASAVAVLR